MWEGRSWVPSSTLSLLLPAVSGLKAERHKGKERQRERNHTAHGMLTVEGKEEHEA